MDFQIAQRPDFVTPLRGDHQPPRAGEFRRKPLRTGSFERATAFERPSGRSSIRAASLRPPDRLHVIFFDWYAGGVDPQMRGAAHSGRHAAGTVKPNLILDSPVEAAVRFSHDPTWGPGLTVDGRELYGWSPSYFAEGCIRDPADLDELFPGGGRIEAWRIRSPSSGPATSWLWPAAGLGPGVILFGRS